MKYAPDTTLTRVTNGTEDVSVFVIKHYKQDSVKVTEEVIKYSTESFIAEVGGVVGIFLGLSFWSLYDLGSALATKKKSFK